MKEVPPFDWQLAFTVLALRVKNIHYLANIGEVPQPLSSYVEQVSAFVDEVVNNASVKPDWIFREEDK